jgi:hypothetical protein
VSRGPLRTAVTGLSLSLLCAGCGAAQVQTATTGTTLPGWRPAADPPGISQLAPDLSGLEVVSRSDARALVRHGDAIRASSFTFRNADQAAEARQRGAGDDYQRQLERAFRGDTVGHGPGVGLRLRVPRPSGTGSDTVEVYLLAHGRSLTVAELVSARGFSPALRDRVLRLLSR